MVIQNYRDIKHRAKQALDYTPWDVKKVALIFALVSFGINLLLMGIDALLVLAINNAAGGLSSLNFYSILEAISSTLALAAGIFNLFWGPAIIYCCMLVIREQNPLPKGLFRGFTKWLPIVKYMLLIFALLLAVVILISPVVAMISMPFLDEYVAILENAPQSEDALSAYIENLPPEQLYAGLAPIAIIMTVALLAIIIPVFYRLRLVIPMLLDDNHPRTWEAIRYSFHTTKGSCKQLFLMDLSFWWYYLLLGVAEALPYAAMLPVFRNWNQMLVQFLLNLATAILGIGAYMLGLVKVKTAEAVAYDHLRTQVLTDLPQLPGGEQYGTNL